MKRRRSEFIVGIVTVVAFAILVVITINLKQIFFFSKTHDIRVTFKSVSGLEVGAPVHVYGVIAGEVKKIDYVSGDRPVMVVLSIRRDMAIYRNANIRIVTAGLIGETKIEIEAGTSDNPRVQGGDTLKGADIVDLYQTLSLAPKIVEDVSVVIHTVKEFVSEEKNQDAFKETVQRFGALSVKLDDLITTTSSDIKAVAATMREVSEKIDTVISDIQNSVAELHATLSDTAASLNRGIETMTTEVNRTSQNISKVASSIEDASVNINSILVDKNQDLRNAINDTALATEHLRTIIERVDTGQGSLGKLINDPSVFYELRDSLRELREILAGLNQSYTRDQIQYEERKRPGASND